VGKVKTVGSAAMLALAIVLLMASGTAAAPSGLTVRGDPHAWAEVEAVLTKFSAQQSYRAKGTMKGGGSMTIEFAKPDRYHTTMDMGGLIESILVGKEFRFRQGTGPWTCPPAGQPAPGPNMDPKSLTGEVAAARGPLETVDGVQTHTYTYAYKTQVGIPGGGPPFEVTTKLFVAPIGLPKRIQTLDKSGAVDMTIDYFDYGAPITITLPACQ
jgi:hypothetical protein